MEGNFKHRIIDLATKVQAYRRDYFKRKRMLEKGLGYKIKHYKGTHTDAVHMEDGNMPVDSSD